MPCSIHAEYFEEIIYHICDLFLINCRCAPKGKIRPVDVRQRRRIFPFPKHHYAFSPRRNGFAGTFSASAKCGRYIFQTKQRNSTIKMYITLSYREFHTFRVCFLPYSASCTDRSQLPTAALALSTRIVRLHLGHIIPACTYTRHYA